MIRITDPMGRPPKAAPVFLIINISAYALYVPYIFHMYSIYISQLCVHVFSLVCFLIYGVKRRQVLIAKPRFHFHFFRFYTFYIFIFSFMIFHQSVNFKPRLQQVHRWSVHTSPFGPIRAHKGPYGPIWAHIWAHKGPYGPIYWPIRAHMGPYGLQPGLGPNPDWAPTRPGWKNKDIF